MSWDLIAMDFPIYAKSVNDIPKGFEPTHLGNRSEIIAQIKQVAPNADFGDQSWGIIVGQDWSIELSMGSEDICKSIGFHLRGGDVAVRVVAAILNDLKLRDRLPDE